MQLTNRQCSFLLFVFLYNWATVCKAQKPGLPGMAPSKWITFRNTHSPGKVYRFNGTDNKTYGHEEYYFRAWIPVLNKKNVGIVIGPHYRTEELELKTKGENPISHMSNWDLRSYGIDLRSFVKLDSTSWLIFTSNTSKSGNFSTLSASSIPLNYTLSAAYLRKKSPDKEIGVGLMVNKSFKLTVLPVFLFNYNYSDNAGIELLLPQRIAWRNNLSASDILYVKSEAVTRTYYTQLGSAGKLPEVCRRIDVDMGVAYNRKLGRYAGFEFFCGYRKNLSHRLIEGVVPVRTSGLAATVELYVQTPKFSRKR